MPISHTLLKFGNHLALELDEDINNKYRIGVCNWGLGSKVNINIELDHKFSIKELQEITQTLLNIKKRNKVIWQGKRKYQRIYIQSLHYYLPNIYRIEVISDASTASFEVNKVQLTKLVNRISSIIEPLSS